MGSYMLPNQKLRGPDWLMLGSLGSGTYLGNEDEETDELVACGIIAGIGHGWNVIDTASNYRNGRGALSARHDPCGSSPCWSQSCSWQDKVLQLLNN